MQSQYRVVQGGHGHPKGMEYKALTSNEILCLQMYVCRLAAYCTISTAGLRILLAQKLLVIFMKMFMGQSLFMLKTHCFFLKGASGYILGFASTDSATKVSFSAN